MEYNQTISPMKMSEFLASREITQIKLKDGTILNINDSNNKKLYEENTEEIDENQMNEEIEIEEKERHNHYKEGKGYFGQHFKTEYSELCPDWVSGGSIIKRRNNYVLYVSKNCSGNDVALKKKQKKKEEVTNEIVNEQINRKINEHIKEQIKEEIQDQTEEQIEQIKDQIKNLEEKIKNIENQTKENIEQIEEENNKEPQIQIEKEIKQNNESEKKEGEGEIVMEGYVECNEVPILEEKIILRNNENENEENICNDCKEENNINCNENICNECNEELKVENNMNDIQENEKDDLQQQNANEIAEDENLCEECLQQNEGQKVTTTVQVLIPEN